MDENQTPAQEPENTTAGEDQAVDLVTLERLIINYINDIERASNELKKHREMLENILMNDAEYQEAHEKAKAAGKEKGKVKSNIMNRPEAATLGEKLATMKKELSEKRNNLSAHLQNYARQAGTTQFEDDEGQVREIVYMAKVVKRSNKFRT